MTPVLQSLDCYFENYDEGHPFIIVGHSQGSAIIKLVLQGYFEEHLYRFERMLAAYPIG